MTCFVFYIERLILRLSLNVKPSGNKTLLTDNYEDSVWANQEAGYMLGKGGKNISLIIDNADIKKFGFLESVQGIIVEQTNIEAWLDKIIALILK